jgi:tetratricopeptide (TPR) repeat protein
MEREIGRGGMGRVYLARDLKLEREVAIKVLAPGPQEGQVLARFGLEARAAASLSHPNIVTVFDVDTTGPVPFIVSEYLRGATLREKLARGSLSLPVALDWAAQLARGLAAAHQKGIVHRDLKPDNVFVTDEGRLKILDFGIARRLEAVAPASAPPALHTGAGAILGTVGYMSPEQVRGEPADLRADVFSFGAMLFELLTGRRAFSRGTQAETQYAILHEDPPALPVGVPHGVDRVLRRCLAKTPGERFPSALEVEAELTRVAQPAGRGRWRWVGLALVVLGLGAGALILAGQRQGERVERRISVAAADFVNETNDDELNGLSGLLITSLEQSRRLSVMTRGRMFDVLRELGRADAVHIDEALGRALCRQAKVDALALASIRRFGEVYVIDVKLLDPVANDYLVTASEQGKGKESIPGLIDRLSERLREGLKEKGEEIRAANAAGAQHTTSNLEAYHHYFLAEQLMERTNSAEGENDQAELELRKAVELDPGFALARYRLGLVLTWTGLRTSLVELEEALRLGLPEREACVTGAWLATGRDHFDEAIALFDGCATRYPDQKDLLFAAGDLRFHRGDLAGAQPWYEQALRLDATFAPAVEHLLITWQGLGRPEKALELTTAYASRVHEAQATDFLSYAQQVAGKNELAIETLKAGMKTFPQDDDLPVRLAVALLISGDVDQAEAVMQSRTAGYSPTIDLYRGRFERVTSSLGVAAAKARENHDARREAKRLTAQALYLALGPGALSLARQTLEQVDRTQPVDFMLTWVALGDADRADQPLVAMLRRADADVRVAALRARARGPTVEAVQEYEQVSRLPYWNPWGLYDLARLRLERGEPQQAIEALRALQAMPCRVDFIFGLFYPRSFYLLGLAQERLGDTAAALASYARFLDLWKDADPGLVELVDARARVAALKGTSP